MESEWPDELCARAGRCESAHLAHARRTLFDVAHIIQQASWKCDTPANDIGLLSSIVKKAAKFTKTRGQGR